MYVFVDVWFDIRHFVETVKLNVSNRALTNNVNTDDNIIHGDGDIIRQNNNRLALLGTIQYSRAIHEALPALEEHFGKGNVVIPKISPLTGGEVLGCTSPTLMTSDDSTKCNICFFCF